MHRRLAHPAHAQHRSTLRALGAGLVLVGGVFAVIGLVSLFSSAGTFGSPDQFWCVFVGLPLLGVGVAMLKAGYLGAMTRYVAGETVPVATDALHHVAEHSKSAVVAFTGAVAAGLRGESAVRHCDACGADAEALARFCQQCGKDLPHVATEIECPACHHDNARASRFCAGCGHRLAVS